MRWYEKGIKFECTACGKCCTNHGDYQYVYLGKSDMEAISAFLKLGIDEFFLKHCDTENGWIVLRPGPSHCEFLGENGCRIYPVRPKQCASWPFWSENLELETWMSQIVPCCEGVGRGALYPADEIDRIARERDDWYT